MKIKLLLTFSLFAILSLCIQAKNESPDYKIEFGKVARCSVFKNENMSIWGGSLVKDDNGLYHMYYSRWPKDLGWAWVTHSEIAHAVSKSPFGPFEFKDIALPARGVEYWDGLCTHNPTIHKIKGRYYLYYMGNTGDGKNPGKPGKQLLNWVHRNNQRIGVAVAENPYGPWKRYDKPVIDISNTKGAHDELMTSNPSVCIRPDGSVLMVYKAVGKQFSPPNYGPVVHMVATADSPTGPFHKHPDPVFTVKGEIFPAEDPYIWFQDNGYHAILKRMKKNEKGRAFSLVQYDSLNGFEWNPSSYHEVSDLSLIWEDGEKQYFDHLERPQVYIENGKPVALLCAADVYDKNHVRHSFNVQIPLIISKMD